MSWSDDDDRVAGSAFPSIDPNSPGIQHIDPFSVNPNDGVQSRAKLNEKSLDRSREAAVAGASFPPALAFSVNGTIHLVDGFHRLEVAKATVARTGRAFTVEVKLGTAREALRAALQSNTLHGTQLTCKRRRNVSVTFLR